MAKRGRPVICVETGRVFDTAKEAAQWLGMVPSCVSQVLKGYNKTAGGYTWAYLGAEKEEIIVEKPRTRPSMTIREVQEEAERRTRETGKFTRYADIQKEETLRMIREGTLCPTKKRK